MGRLEEGLAQEEGGDSLRVVHRDRDKRSDKDRDRARDKLRVQQRRLAALGFRWVGRGLGGDGGERGVTRVESRTGSE